MKLTELHPGVRDLNQVGMFYSGTPASTSRIQPKASHQRNPSCTTVPLTNEYFEFHPQSLPSECVARGVSLSVRR